MALTTFAHVAQHIATVTPEEIGRCHKIFGPDHKSFYAVQNERGDIGLDGEIVEYAVKYDRDLGWSCTCKAGSLGFAHVKHPSGVCKHVRWAVAAALEERAYIQALSEKNAEEKLLRQAAAWNPQNETSYYRGTRAHILLTGKLEADDATYTRVMLAQPKEVDEQEIQREAKQQERRQASNAAFWEHLKKEGPNREQ